jgi:hypothetical protein
VIEDSSVRFESRVPIVGSKRQNALQRTRFRCNAKWISIEGADVCPAEQPQATVDDRARSGLDVGDTAKREPPARQRRSPEWLGVRAADTHVGAIQV